MLASCGVRIEELGGDASTPGLRDAISRCARRCEDLLAESAGFAREIRDRRLAIEVAVIQRLAEDLARRLQERDPLAERVVHRKGEALGLAARAAIGRLLGR